MKGPQGLHIDFLRQADGDFTLGGVSSKARGGTIVSILDRGVRPATLKAVPANWAVAMANDAAPAMWLQRLPISNGTVAWSILPAPADWYTGDLPGWYTSWMAGGNYATGDSRLTKLIGFFGALSVHDRREP